MRNFKFVKGRGYEYGVVWGWGVINVQVDRNRGR